VARPTVSYTFFYLVKGMFWFD